MGIDTKSTHVTPARGNVDAGLGFESEEAAELKAESQQIIAAKLDKMLQALFEHWQLPPEDQAILRGLRDTEPAALGYVFGIHKNLRLLFPHNRELAYRFITTSNSAFESLSPMGFIKQRGYPGLLAVHRYLVAQMS